MERTAGATEQKLMGALMQFKRLGWHQQSIAGCKPSEIRVLFCIRKGMRSDMPEMKVSEISKLLQVTPPTVTQLLKGLEAHGLVERHDDPTDRRSVGISLTKKGEMVTQKALDAFYGSLHGLIEYLGEEQSNQLVDLLTKVSRYYHEKAAHMDYSYWNGELEA